MGGEESNGQEKAVNLFLDQECSSALGGTAFFVCGSRITAQKTIRLLCVHFLRDLVHKNKFFNRFPNLCNLPEIPSSAFT